jgi:hypothetical protein
MFSWSHVEFDSSGGIMSMRRAVVSCMIGCTLLVLLSAYARPQSSAVGPPQSSPQGLTCSPAPCVLPNLRLPGRNLGGFVDSIVADPSNVSQMLLSSDDGSCGSFIGFYSTSDAGTTWRHSCIPLFDGLGGTMAGYDLNSVAFGGGVLDDSAIVIRSSTDNGVHWGRAKVADADGGGLGEPRLAVDDSPTSAFANTLYIADIHFSTTQVHVSHSSDGGQHWTGNSLDKKQNPAVDVSPYVSIGADGLAYVTWFRCKLDGPNHDCGKTTVPILLSKSIDGGNSWSVPSIIAYTTLTPTFGCAFGYGCLPNTLWGVANIPVSAVFGGGENAKVYVAFYNWTGTQMQVEVITSSDSGTTFGPPTRVSSSGVGDQFYPWISLSAGGTLGVTWLDRRKDPANLKYQPFFATSADGVHFTPSRFLSTTLSDPTAARFSGAQVNAWIGSKLFSGWTDTRSGLPRIELGGAQF